MITLQRQAPARPDAAEVLSTESRGCGGFDSSYELARGAQVSEGLSVEEFELWVYVSSRRQAAQVGRLALS